MKKGKCPKCESPDVHVVTTTTSEVAISINWLNTAFLDYYVCAKCGYVEMFVRDPSMLPKIAEKYPIAR